jgi:hypothetical protein
VTNILLLMCATTVPTFFVFVYGSTVLSVNDAYEFPTFSERLVLGDREAYSHGGVDIVRVAITGCVSRCAGVVRDTQWLGWLMELLILHCIAWLAWMVYPDLALSVWCGGA